MSDRPVFNNSELEKREQQDAALRRISSLREAALASFAASDGNDNDVMRKEPIIARRKLTTNSR